MIDSPMSRALRSRAMRIWSVVLLVTATTVLGPFVPVATATAFAYNCDGTSRASHHIVTKDFTSTPWYIKDAAGDAAVRQLAPCNQIGIDVPGAQYDEPFVWLASLQAYNNGTDDPYIVQVGYARCGRTGFLVSCGGTPGDNNMYMVYTDSDHSGGEIHQANWYNGGAKLKVGDRYRGRLSRLTSGCGIGQADCWQICARDITANETYDCTTIDYTWPTSNGGNLAWWGAETNNYASQMGAAATSADFNMDYMQYRSSQAGATWTVRTDLPSCSIHTGPSYYHCAITSTVYNADTLFAFTELH